MNFEYSVNTQFALLTRSWIHEADYKLMKWGKKLMIIQAKLMIFQ